MIERSELAVAGLVLLGGGAMGAALGGLVAGMMKWTGGAMHGAVASCIVAGAVIGLIAVEAPTLRKLGPFMAKAQESGEGAQMLAAAGDRREPRPDDGGAAAGGHAADAAATAAGGHRQRPGRAAAVQRPAENSSPAIRSSASGC